jgi:gephyrin
LPGVYTVLTPSTHNLSSFLPTDRIYRINTGAPLPDGTDAVIMVEDTRVASTTKDDKGRDVEEATVETLAHVEKGENVRAPGSDARKGEVVLERGEVVGSVGGEVGTLAFVGRKSVSLFPQSINAALSTHENHCQQVKVYKKPVVALLSTGNELIDVQTTESQASSPSGWSGIFDTNRPSLQAALEGMGYTVLDLGIVPDECVVYFLSAHHFRLTFTRWTANPPLLPPSIAGSRRLT